MITDPWVYWSILILLVLNTGISYECLFQNLISAQGFLRMNTDSWVNSTIFIFLALKTRTSYEWLFQNLRTKYVSMSDGICRTEEMYMNIQLSFILLIQHFKVNLSFHIISYHKYTISCRKYHRKKLNLLNEHWL